MKRYFVNFLNFEQGNPYDIALPQAHESGSAHVVYGATNAVYGTTPDGCRGENRYENNRTHDASSGPKGGLIGPKNLGDFGFFP